MSKGHASTTKQQAGKSSQIINAAPGISPRYELHPYTLEYDGSHIGSVNVDNRHKGRTNPQNNFKTHNAPSLGRCSSPTQVDDRLQGTLPAWTQQAHPIQVNGNTKPTNVDVPLQVKPHFTSNIHTNSPQPAQPAPIKIKEEHLGKTPELEFTRQTDRIKRIWPDVTEEARKQFPEFAHLYDTIKASSTPNFRGVRIPLESDLNILNWRTCLEEYHDKILCEYLEFGWPIGYHANSPPATTERNHPSANAHQQHVDRFIKTELACNAILGPFSSEPFTPWTRISPIMTRPKKGSDDRRIIIDLSFPRGLAVNDGIAIENHFGADISYSLPSIADFADRLVDQGQGAWLWKSDLTRAYRQFRVDPMDCPFLGMRVGSSIYLDLCPPFGCRSSAAICQRVATALVYVMSNRGHFMTAYLDDFGGCHRDKTSADQAFKEFKKLTSDLGLALAENKSVPPTTAMEWLGYDVNSVTMSITIPPVKLQAVLDECTNWLTRTRASKTMIQTLVGRLIYISNCVRPGRKFIARILMTLRAMADREWTTIGQEFKADVKWFLEYAKEANGVFLLPVNVTQFNVFCDSSLHGGGGHDHTSYFTWKYTNAHKSKYTDIHHLEAINVLVAYKTLVPNTINRPGSVCIWTDNMASSLALETGRTKDAVLAACAREIWLHAAHLNHSITIKHISGTKIPLADALSRSSHDSKMAQSAKSSITRLGLREKAPVLNGYKFFSPLL